MLLHILSKPLHSLPSLDGLQDIEDKMHCTPFPLWSYQENRRLKYIFSEKAQLEISKRFIAILYHLCNHDWQAEPSTRTLQSCLNAKAKVNYILNDSGALFATSYCAWNVCACFLIKLRRALWIGEHYVRGLKTRVLIKVWILVLSFGTRFCNSKLNLGGG